MNDLTRVANIPWLFICLALYGAMSFVDDVFTLLKLYKRRAEVTDG